ncbi:hypothetical protein [Pseudoxanthomonas sacheonensis]|uniref:Lipoprotein n=1 Tax=Pseudoxanthomonas sacheonensis TaxID=443615 RepID=A0ABU1RR25_9GAMM|nr:hypothetical protein [Pseudoxanthomonas sacheonensis]MDR6841233.1 hypothetical protein [Pseudoxanthomonas sacheonensis]
MFKIVTDYSRAYSVMVAILILLVGCTVDRYPDDTIVKQDFMRLVPQRIPPDVEVNFIDTYRSDGDGQSFSQVFVFDVNANRRISIENGWLKGSFLVPGDEVRRRKVEFIYQKKGDRWKVVSDGPISSK